MEERRRSREKWTGKLVELEGEGDGEKEELVGDSDEEGDDEVVVVQRVDCHDGSGEPGQALPCREQRKLIYENADCWKEHMGGIPTLVLNMFYKQL